MNTASFWKSQVNLHRQTMDTFSQLEEMKFGLKELKQLWYTILEIAEANNVESDKAVTKFLKDIEEQYDHKLGFENKVKEKRDELVLLNNEINNKRLILQATPFIGSTLYHLFQKGLSEQDIIGINQLAQHYANNTFRDNVDPHDKANNDEDSKVSTTRSDLWKTLIDELKKYGYQSCNKRTIRKTSEVK
jgi:hypothetical protein